MKLLNPIYDSVFKYLMEDLEIAKGFISIIIGTEIIELYPAPQETTSIELMLKHNQLPLHRMDYVAIIRTVENKVEKVVIEVQKSSLIPEIERFRNYLAEKYSKTSTYTLNNEQVVEHLPIKTIYILDKKISDELPAVLHRKGEYYDVLYQRKYKGKKNKYVELLAHDTWFIQVEKLPEDLKNELAMILSVFAPWMRDKEEEIYINIEEKELLDKKHALLQRILRRLENATRDKNLLLTLKTESQIEDEIDKYIKQAEQERQQKEEERKQKEEERKQKEEAQQREEKERQQKEEERKQKEEAQRREEKERQQKEEAQQKIIDLAKMLKNLNIPIEQIIEKTGLSKKEIEKL